MRLKAVVLGITYFTLVFSTTQAHVPKMLNYQGKLTTQQGALVDTTVTINFTIYSDSTGSDSLWSETQSSVVVQYGVFSVLLGSVNMIPESVFTGDVRYLGIKVGNDSEMTPRRAIVSVGYAYRSAVADTANFVRNGDIGCHDCDSVFVNVTGPESVIATQGAAFTGEVYGASTSSMYGIHGFSDNTSSGVAFGGYFHTSSSGTGYHVGVVAEGFGSSSSYTDGIKGYAQNSSTGDAVGGYFNTSSLGTGSHYGTYAEAYGASNSTTFGTYSYAQNNSDGSVCGGYFKADSFGTGSHCGVMGKGYGNSDSSVSGVHGYALNTSTGNAVGAYGNSEHTSSGTALGFYGYASNNSSGNAYGALLRTDASGTGTHYGLRTEGYAASAAATFGSYNYALNDGEGNVYAGYFLTDPTGEGIKYGVYAYTEPSKGFAGYFAGDVQVENNLGVWGGKSAAVKVDNGEYRLLYSQESPEVWFEDFGEGQLINGRVHIELDSLFLQTVTISSQYPMKVFITLNDECSGIYVKRGNTGFDVVELHNGASNAAFTYRVVAKRKGFENRRLPRMEGPTPEEIKAEQAKYKAELEQERVMITEQRTNLHGEKSRR